MSDLEWNAPPAASLELTSSDLAEGRASLESEIAVHHCSSCGAALADRYHLDCPECGHDGPPSTRCGACSGSLRPERVRYIAKASSGGEVTKVLAGVTCETCGVYGVEHHQLDKLAELAEMLDEPLQFLPEVGIYTPGMLEVLADAEVACPGAPDEIAKEHDGLSMRIGNPSDLFDAALDLVTEHEPGAVFSPTLRVTPGPPYTAAQRRALHVLLGQIQCDLAAPVVCWSASVGLSDDPPIDTVLMEQLSSWQADPGRLGLALYNDIVADRAPGRFLNTVRLLELVLARRGRGEALEERASRLHTTSEVGEQISRLGSQLSGAVCSLKPTASSILQRLWLTLRPGHEFDEGAVCAAAAQFPQSYLEQPEGEGPRLPWEEPDFDGYARELQKLISALLE